MAKNIFVPSWGLIGIGALMAGLVAILLQPLGPLHDQSVWTSIARLREWNHPLPVVVDTTRDISYLGVRGPSVEHFHNIFYAHDTSGANRFAPPVPVIPAPNTVIDATTPGAWCPQATGGILPFTSLVTNISENCLSLRVARLSGTKPEASLPVLVWLHGGGHALGSAEDDLYTPDGLIEQAAADGQPLIYVAVNYRLGFFGFAKSRALVEAGHTNAGLRDQRAALEWVRDNIAWFGGDPTRVTVVGQSVGASDISLQLTAWGGERGAVPFQQAVLMSGGPGLNFNTRSELVADNTEAVAKQAGCVQEAQDGQSAEALKCLREASSEVLTKISVTAMREARPPFGEGYFFPTFDADFLPDRPSELVRAGRVTKDIPVIAAWVTNDGAWYASPTTSTDDEVLATFGLWLTGLSEATKKKLLELYPVADFQHLVSGPGEGVSPQYYRAAQLNRDLWFTCPVLDFAWQYGRHNGGNVHVYEHNATRYSPVFENMGVPMWRVAHLSDIPYVLKSQKLGGGADNSAEQLLLSNEVSRRIAGFVTSGIPDKEWPVAFEGASEAELENEFPERLSLQPFGGPYGNGPVSVQRSRRIEGDVPSTLAEEAIEWERLFERCDFINSAEVRRETGV
ncbi:hypothetical protein SLS53_001412 [Cytospora paraplurivora]|uniref:Carboxylesterase type B domain-containing protein n=1 Tax=Cytospora paraplurivora TaxID=2898453 RepID=A0AAN9YML5_9PEZI